MDSAHTLTLLQVALSELSLWVNLIPRVVQPTLKPIHSLGEDQFTALLSPLLISMAIVFPFNLPLSIYLWSSCDSLVITLFNLLGYRIALCTCTLTLTHTS